MLDQGTWMDREERAYNVGLSRSPRWGMARSRDAQGALVAVRLGVPDTFFSIPAIRADGIKGFVSLTDNVLIFTAAAGGSAARANVYRITPYLPGRGPTVTVELGDYPKVYAVQGRKRTLVFHVGPYRPGLGARTARQQAAEVIAFAVAYAERPEKFDRDPSDYEQIHRAWWVQHGDAISAAVEG